jgi:hypothetical protein
MSAAASTYRPMWPVHALQYEKERCIEAKVAPLEMHLRLPVPHGFANGTDKLTPIQGSSRYANATVWFGFVEYGPSVRRAIACCPTKRSEPTPRIELTPVVQDEAGLGLPYVNFSSSMITPDMQEETFRMTLALQRFEAEPIECAMEAWASDDLEGGFGGFLEGSRAGGTGGSTFGESGSGTADLKGSGGGLSGEGDLISAGHSSRPGFLGVSPPLMLLPDSSNTPDSPREDLTVEFRELQTELLSPQEDPRGGDPSRPPLTVPGPIAGAGVPALLLWGVLSWARRRNVLASVS